MGTCSSLFSVQPGAAYVQHQDVGLFPRGDPLDDQCGKSRDPAPRESEPCPPVLPSAAGPFHQSFALSSRRNAPQPRGELATFTLLFKLARRHHQQITLSCLAARPDSAHISLLTWSWTLGTKTRSQPQARGLSCSAQKGVPFGVLSLLGRRQRRRLHPQVNWALTGHLKAAHGRPESPRRGVHSYATGEYTANKT